MSAPIHAQSYWMFDDVRWWSFINNQTDQQFLGTQGFDKTDSIIHQYNQSAMLLENHGKNSSSK